MSIKRDKAINHLRWYFKTLFIKAGFCWDEYNDADIECLIDLIIDAAAERSDLCCETYKARTAKRCNECLECHHFGNGCDGDSEPCEAFEYPY